MEQDIEIILGKIEELWNKHNSVINKLIKPVVNYYELSDEQRKTAVHLMKNTLFDHSCEFDVEMGEIVQLLEQEKLQQEMQAKIEISGGYFKLSEPVEDLFAKLIKKLIHKKFTIVLIIF